MTGQRSLLLGGDFRLEFDGGPALGKLVAVKLVRPMFGSIGCDHNRSTPTPDLFAVSHGQLLWIVRSGEPPIPVSEMPQAFEYLRDLDNEIPWCDPGFPNAVWWESINISEPSVINASAKS